MLGIGSDHGGFQLKQAIMAHLRKRGIEYKDFGTYTEASCDYPEYGRAVALAVAAGECDRGILICGTGIGISITANKVPASGRPCARTVFPPRPPACTTTPISWHWAAGWWARVWP